MRTPKLPFAEETHIGPAQVVSSEAADSPALVLLADGRTVQPEWALPFRYVAERGDVLTVVSRADRHYVLNVVHGRGRSLLAFRGDAELGARDGILKLQGDRGVRLAGKRLTLRTKVLETVTRLLQSKVGSASATISGKEFERAGESRRLIEGDDWHSAGERTLVAQDSVRMDGDLIRVS